MQLPEHTFYVDFIYAYQPFPWVKSLQYVDTPFYHYFIGRDGQSVQTDVMIPTRGPAAARQPVHGARHPRTRYGARRPIPLHDSFSGDSEFRRERFHDFVARSGELREEEGHVGGYRAYSPTIYKDVRKKAMSRALNLHGSLGRFVIRKGYFVAEHVVGFN